MVATTTNQQLPPYDEVENIVTTVLNIFDGALDVEGVDEDPENFIQSSNDTLDSLLERITAIDSVLGARLNHSFGRAKELLLRIVDV